MSSQSFLKRPTVTLEVVEVMETACSKEIHGLRHMIRYNVPCSDEGGRRTAARL